MALIQCPKCSGTVSDKAPRCIHCGFPLADSNSVPSMQHFSIPSASDKNVEMPNFSICKTCGSKIPEGMGFCPKCGKSIHSMSKELTPMKKSAPPKWPIFVLVLAIIAVGSFIILYLNGFWNDKSPLPYGVEWSDTRERVLEKDSNAKASTSSDANNCLDQNNGTFFGIQKEAVSALILYKYAGDQLDEISILCLVDNDILSDNEFIDIIHKYYTDKTGSTSQMADTSYIWTLSDTTIDFTYIVDGTFSVTYTQR